ncbi:MAG: hypothetical protein ACE5EN_03165 [Nitrospinota bacterium]
MGRGFFTLILAAVIASTAFAKPVRIKNRFQDSLPTNVMGTSLASPPYIQVIRSKRGAAHLLNRFRAFNNLNAVIRLRKLKRQLRSVNYSKRMVIAVLSQPVDNYELKVNKVAVEDDVIKVDVSYKHELKNYQIPPKKSIHFVMVVVEKMPQPAVLETRQIKVKTKTKKTKKVTVTGRLMLWKESAYQLVPVRIRRGKKQSYYIRGEKLEELAPYLGKVITLAGTISHERDGPYESELTVQKVVKVYD